MASTRWSLYIDEKILKELREIQEEKKMDEPDQRVYRSLNNFVVSILKARITKENFDKLDA